MTEPEILKTLERLEKEELLDAVNPELPLPTNGNEDYLSILQDLRSALGEPDEPFAEPETPFADPQNILELDAEQVSAAEAAQFENEFELLPETAGFDLSADETDAGLSDFEFKLPDEVLLQEETCVAVESIESESLKVAESEPELKADVTEDADSLQVAEVLSTTQFSGEAQSTVVEEANDSFSFQEENPAAEFSSNSDFPIETEEKTEQNDFAFVPSLEEAEFPEILSDDEQADEFQSEDSVQVEMLSSEAQEAVSDFEPQNFDSETEDFSDFLPEAERDFLGELERKPEPPQLETPETSFEILPEPSLADESEETNEARNPFVVFKLDTEYFAFPASVVAEIGHEPQLSALPFVPSWFSGISNLRGDVIAVLDLRGLWEMRAFPTDARRKMLVVHSEKENLTVGLLVDAVSEIRYLGESEINSAQEFSDQPFAFCLNGASRKNETVLRILDVERLLASPKLRQF